MGIFSWSLLAHHKSFREEPMAVQFYRCRADGLIFLLVHFHYESGNHTCALVPCKWAVGMFTC